MPNEEKELLTTRYKMRLLQNCVAENQYCRTNSNSVVAIVNSYYPLHSRQKCQINVFNIQECIIEQGSDEVGGFTPILEKPSGIMLLVGSVAGSLIGILTAIDQCRSSW